MRRQASVLFSAIFAAIILLMFMLSATGCAPSKPSAASPDGFAAQILTRYPELKGHNYQVLKVKRVVDGDTFETEDKQKVRLIGVNTPESVKPGTPVEYFAKEASSFSKQQLTGKSVYLFKDVEDKDKYGRLLRYVFIEGQTKMYNETLVSEGYANTMTIPPNVMFSKTFVKLERDTREHKKGLWGKE